LKLVNGFFDPEAIDPKFKNVDASAGTVDIEYNLERIKPDELQGGYGGGGFIGTGTIFQQFLG
jgi:outer membrane protein insertion porin family